jgi:hypothetical protein
MALYKNEEKKVPNSLLITFYWEEENFVGEKSLG